MKFIQKDKKDRLNRIVYNEIYISIRIEHKDITGTDFEQEEFMNT